MSVLRDDGEQGVLGGGKSREHSKKESSIIIVTKLPMKLHLMSMVEL